MNKFQSRLMRSPWLRKYAALVREDLTATYSRDLHRWLIVAPIMGVFTGLLVTLIVEVILQWMWPPILRYYIAHPLVMIPGITAGFVVAGFLMQYLTPNPNEHSTEEIIRSYHEHQGDVQMRPYVPKLIAAIATVGMGGSAALEGPGIYAGGGLGSWLWAKLRRVGLEPRDRRIMVISGAAAGMSAVFRAPLTGIIFALEMPYKDDLAHEALLPALIASVTSFATLAAFLGAQPLFDFASAQTYTGRDLLWSALLGVLCGLFVMAFDITFRRVRQFAIRAAVPHWIKMAVGGFLTGVCGLAFLSVFRGNLVPVGPNYEAVHMVLQGVHSSLELFIFGFFKLLATLFSLGVGGVSAMFVPLFLTGGSFGAAFAQAVVHTSSVDLYAAVGMAALIAAGYKTPLTAVVFVAEATGGHAYIIPSLIGAAVAYAVSGEASVSGDQRLREGLKASELSRITVREVMQKHVVAVDANVMLRHFADSISAQYPHAVYPVYQDDNIVGTISVSALTKLSPQKWEQMKVRDIMERHVVMVTPKSDLEEALRLLMGQNGQHMLLVRSESGKLEGVLTKTDVLSALDTSILNAGATDNPVLRPSDT